MANVPNNPANDPLLEARRWYAQEGRYASGTESEQIIEAYATVPRERFLGPGPWQVRSIANRKPGYVQTPDDDPVHVYHNVLIAIDASRNLNNGSPGAWAAWLSAIGPHAGDQILHIGCGTGYYSAILAELTGAGGSVLAFELDSHIAEQARRALESWHQVHVVAADGATFEPDPTDLIIVSAGVTSLPLPWLACLKPQGRLLVPLTAQFGDSEQMTQGRMLAIRKMPNAFAARFVSYAGFYPCIGTQDESLSKELIAAFERRDDDQLQSVRLDEHAPGKECWLHTDSWCLSRRA